MTNEQILNERWKNTNIYLIEWLNGYNKINRKTKDNIQNILNSIKITYSELNKHISKSEKDKIDRFILELQEKELLKGYFGYEARLILNKKYITYREMIEFLILASYMEENNLLIPLNMILFTQISKEHYEMGLKDIGNTSMSFKLPILYTILNSPMFNATSEAYLMALAEQNAMETYKHTLTCLQLEKDLNIDNKSYEELFRKQRNKYLSIKNDKTSGTLENIVEGIANQSYLQAGIDTNTKECIFISEMDNKTTRMCETLNNQIFKLNEMNTYQRYSDLDKKIIVYNTKGLQIGQNLPPINNHFHWCRSTISYNIKIGEKLYKEITNEWLKITKVEGHNDTKMLDDVFIYKNNKYKIDGKYVKYEFKKGEKEFANWLSKNTNKRITLLPKINKPEGIKTPDYLIDNEYYDFKYTTGNSNQLLSHNIRGNMEQSNNYIFEITKSNFELSDMLTQIDSCFKIYKWVDKIAIKKNDKLIIYQRK